MRRKRKKRKANETVKGRRAQQPKEKKGKITCREKVMLIYESNETSECPCRNGMCLDLEVKKVDQLRLPCPSSSIGAEVNLTFVTNPLCRLYHQIAFNFSITKSKLADE